MNTVAEMRESVFFAGGRTDPRRSRFWLLLTLASVIAAAGVVGDSTATVIGAMIVAPLMSPILGIVLATVIGDRENLLRCWLYVVGGLAAAIAIGYLVGLVVAAPVVASTNGQVSARVTPGLIDLLAALATGLVGAVALVRRDISNTLPGVAVSISLVPPLTVVGLTIESGAWGEALGAFLLFVANVTAILATGVVVLAGYRIGSHLQAEHDDDGTTGADGGWGGRRRALVSILATVVVIGIPLTISSVRFTDQSLLEDSVRDAVVPWSEQVSWSLAGLKADGDDHVTVRLTGELPTPDTAELAERLRDEGVDPDDVTLEFIPAFTSTPGEDPAG